MTTCTTHLGTFHSPLTHDEDHDLYLDEAAQTLVVAVSTEEGTATYPLDAYLDSHPDRRTAVLAAIRSHLA